MMICPFVLPSLPTRFRFRFRCCCLYYRYCCCYFLARNPWLRRPLSTEFCPPGICRWSSLPFYWRRRRWRRRASRTGRRLKRAKVTRLVSSPLRLVSQTPVWSRTRWKFYLASVQTTIAGECIMAKARK